MCYSSNCFKFLCDLFAIEIFIIESCLNLGPNSKVRRLSKDQFYKCPFSHSHPQHKQIFFKDFDRHFRIFSNKDDHLEVAQLHEQLTWESRRLASEKGSLSQQDIKNISFESWLEAIKKKTGKSIQIVRK